MDIGRRVRTMEQMLTKDPEISQNPIAKNVNVVYNDFSVVKRESETRENTEKGDVSNDENGLHEQSGLSDSERADGRSEGELTRTLREDAQGVSEGTSQRTVSGTSDDGQAVGAPLGDRRDGEPENGTADRELYEIGGRERTAQSDQSVSVGRRDEQYSGKSRRNRHERTDLQLNIFSDSDELSDIFFR